MSDILSSVRRHYRHYSKRKHLSAVQLQSEIAFSLNYVALCDRKLAESVRMANSPEAPDYNEWVDHKQKAHCRLNHFRQLLTAADK